MLSHPNNAESEPSRLALAVDEASRILFENQFHQLTQEELTGYKDRGYVIVRGVIPERLATVICEQIIYPGFKESGLDVQDPSTWGIAKEKLSWLGNLATKVVSETSYHGGWRSFSRGLEPEYRSDVTAAELGSLRQAFSLANEIAAKHVRVILDQIAGKGVWDERLLGDWISEPLDKGLPKKLHVRYGLSTKDASCSVADHRWPCIGWHIDGAWNDHQLGQRREQSEQRCPQPDYACVGILTYNEVLPLGGLTGVLPGSHKINMQTVLRHTPCGGIPNARLLVGQSIFGGSAADPLSFEDLRLRPGDALFMHPYLSHSSAWNYREGLRVGSRFTLSYKRPHTAETLQEMGRQQEGCISEKEGACLPPNTELYLQALEGSTWQAADWNNAPGSMRVFIYRKLGLERGDRRYLPKGILLMTASSLVFFVAAVILSRRLYS